MCQLLQKKHKTVGFYSEEKGEPMHKVVNQQSRQLCSVRNPAERNLLIHKNMELSSNTKCQCFWQCHPAESANLVFNWNWFGSLHDKPTTCGSYRSSISSLELVAYGTFH